MRFVRLLLIVLLAVSVLGNIMLYQRTAGRRVQASVNGAKINKKDYDDWLELHHGVQAMADMIRYNLVKQAAEKANLWPDSKEVDKQIKEISERNPNVARQLKYQPWTENDIRQSIEYNLALQNLATKDVKATDDELRDFFAAQPDKWNEPDKLYTKSVQCASDSMADKVKQLMERVTDLTVVAQQYPGQAGPVGADGTWVLVKPVGGASPAPQINEIAAMKDGEVRKFTGGIFGKAFVVVKREKMVPGRKVAFNEVKDKVARDFKATRQKPPQEVLQNLWDEAKIETEDPALRANVERLIFPERAEMKQAASATP